MTTQINRTANQIKIEDIQPEVFQELLRFIYSGRVSTAILRELFDKCLDGEFFKHCRVKQVSLT